MSGRREPASNRTRGASVAEPSLTTMEAEKIRNTTDVELRHHEQELNDQLFRLKFQLKMGQTESLQKMRGLRKDIARIQTITRERELGLGAAAGSATTPAKPVKKVAAPKPAASKRSAKKSAGESAAKKTVKKSEKK